MLFLPGRGYALRVARERGLVSGNVVGRFDFPRPASAQIIAGIPRARSKTAALFSPLLNQIVNPLLEDVRTRHPSLLDDARKPLGMALVINPFRREFGDPRGSTLARPKRMIGNRNWAFGWLPAIILAPSRYWIVSLG